MRLGLIGGALGYQALRFIRRENPLKDPCDGSCYRGRNKLEVLFGPRIWAQVAGKVVIDFGCGDGTEVVEIARHRARRVIGIDMRQRVLRLGSLAADKARVSERCVFATHTDEQADVILSIDCFEHYENPAQVLDVMAQLLKPAGRVFVSFGPPWFHPFGGHLFSVFPWAHLIFSERALIRWRSDFKSDGATRFREVEGGLNQMTVRRFRKLLGESAFEIERFEAVPIRRLRYLSNPVTREFFTSIVRCTLVPRGSRQTFRDRA